MTNDNYINTYTETGGVVIDKLEEDIETLKNKNKNLVSNSAG